MAARAMWKGQLKVGTTKLPVKLYSAVQDKTVRFHILDDKSKARVKQHMIDPDSGEEVASEEIQKGYEVEPGKFVILTQEDLEKSNRLHRATSRSWSLFRKTKSASSGMTGPITSDRTPTRKSISHLSKLSITKRLKESRNG